MNSIAGIFADWDASDNLHSFPGTDPLSEHMSKVTRIEFSVITGRRLQEHMSNWGPEESVARCDAGKDTFLEESDGAAHGEFCPCRSGPMQAPTCGVALHACGHHYRLSPAATVFRSR
jgi:hypothetical protein